MIRFLIRLAAEKGAREIERGSPAGAAVGAIVGCAGGVLIPYLLYAAEIIEQNWVEHSISFGIGLALAGGFIGSLVPVRKKTAEPWNAKISDSSSIRITNYNHALAPVLLFLLFTALIVFAISAAVLDPAKARAEWLEKFDPRALLFPVIYIAVLILAMRAKLWLEIGPEIRIRSLLRTKTFTPKEIANWYFSGNNGRMGRFPPTVGPLQIVLLFRNGGSIQLPIKTQLAAPIAEILGRHVGSN